uniref:Inner membrane protein n=1 Tax=Heterorhabditis bacteriophora TaxID=37862 RepID=A0A1I7WUJ2_HETBA
MPFLKIDFSNYNSSDALQKELEQRVWIVLISALLFIGALIASYNAEPVYFSLYCWGIIDFSFLIYWNLSRKEVDFFKQLMRSSTGVGILRKTKKNVMVKNLATSLSLVVAICTIIILSISLFDQSLAKIFFSIISLATVIFCLPGANCAVFSHITQLSSEFFVIANDFHQDGNTYQIAVSKHYVHAHCQLIKLFNSVRKPLSSAISLRASIVELRYLMLELLSGDKALHDQVWSI